MTVHQYIDNINKRFLLGNATEHTFRGDLLQLIEAIVPHVSVTNEPKRRDCGAPDYILMKGDIPVGFIEAKVIGDKDLAGLKKKPGNKEQFDRYKASLENLIFTDYLDFHLYLYDVPVTSVAIGEITPTGIKPLPHNFAAFENLIRDFSIHVGQTIKSPKKLAEMMAGKARLLSDIIERSLNSDEEQHEDSTLKDQMKAFKYILIHDITPKGFADVYAQTIAYGMFAARLHDSSLPTFSRQEAAELIPKSNPFLRKLFGYIAGPDIDDRIKWVVDSLVEIFLACNVLEILRNYGKATKMEDPIIHFYETFLSEYDPKLKKSRGVWYTPAPVVNFIVRAVDDILKTDFGLPQGLADTSKTKVTVNTQIEDKRSSTGYRKEEKLVHKVQILDPATGTGTFLAETVKHIHKRFQGQQGIWSNYVEKHLLPRLNGFELLMASYAMAHLKLDLLLTETGYRPTSNQRLRVYLTNSLEENHPDTGTFWANWLSSEANEANHIKRDTPVMVVLGNPPYSVSSTNRGEWIEKLTADYKRGLTERNIQPLSDDYIKFIRYGQHYIDKNGSGVLAYISNNSFIDGVSHRQMRRQLLASFDSIYIIDLHGNAKKKETAPDGTSDKNVFDIMQGVSINIFVKSEVKKKDELGSIFHFDLYGKREFKYEFLEKSSVQGLEWNRLENIAPNYFFTKKDFSSESSYLGFSLEEVFKNNGAGVQTKRDNLFIDFSESSIADRISRLLHKQFSEEEKQALNIKNSSSYRLVEKIDIQKFDTKYIRKYNYRVFDDRFIYYDKDLLGRSFYKIMQHMLKDNHGLIVCKQQSTFDFQHVFVTKFLTDHNSISLQTKEASFAFPLYLYPKTSSQQILGTTRGRIPNLNSDIVRQISEALKIRFVPEKEVEEHVSYAMAAEERPEYRSSFAPIDILDYIYAVLHSPTYREKYKEFLKIDFPRVPYPQDADVFWQLVELGGQIRHIHLLESPLVDRYVTQYPIDGDNVVTKPVYKDGRVYINDSQYFDKVPAVAWSFYIGGYQPAQKWLKDRKGRELGYEDILHYQRIIVALIETDRLMKEIDEIDFIY